MGHYNKYDVERWMKQWAGEYLDDCGEVNMTELAESACDEFNGQGPAPNYDTPEEFFELAFRVAEWFERQ
jgi:hypothetical protein